MHTCQYYALQNTTLVEENMDRFSEHIPSIATGPTSRNGACQTHPECHKNPTGASRCTFPYLMEHHVENLALRK